MRIAIQKPRAARAGIIQLPTEEIDPNPTQPRRAFDEETLRELSESIARYGVISPLSVRLHYGRYELVAGERRLRAAKMAGLDTVPCMVLDVDLEESSLLALVENIQRQDLDYIEEALGISQLMRLFALSQEEAAARIGRSQSAVANKLRLLKLPPDILASLREHGLTERHGRALLRLAGAEEQRGALEFIVSHALNVAQTDAYVEKLLEDSARSREPAPHRAFILKDVRLFLNTLTRSLDMMKQGGIAAGMEKKETETELIVTISIPKGRPGESGKERPAGGA